MRFRVFGKETMYIFITADRFHISVDIEKTYMRSLRQVLCDGSNDPFRKASVYDVTM